jgi:CRISPR-associated protein Cas5a/b/c
MLTLLVKGAFHWGFSVRIVTESAGAQYYPYPPPSTLIGALAYGLSALKGLPECRLSASSGGRAALLSNAASTYGIVRWAAFAFSDELSVVQRSAAVGYSDFIRAFRLPYQRGARHTWEQRDMWYGVSAHGKVYACGAGFKAFYLIDEGRLKDLGVNDSDLLTAAYSIVRIGVRESLVSVTAVEASRDIRASMAEEVKRPFETEYYFPARLAEDVEEAETTHLPKLDVKLWEFRPESPIALHDHEGYYMPSRLAFILTPGRMRINKLAKGGALLTARFNDNRVERLVVPIDVVRP